MRKGRGSIKKRNRETARDAWREEKQRRKVERHGVIPRVVRFGEEDVQWTEESNAQ